MATRIELFVARDTLRVSSQTLTREFGTALLLVPSAGVPRIAEAGELEEAILARIGDLVSKGVVPSSFILRRPGESRWWDAAIASPKPKNGLSSPADDSEALLVSPLRPSSWSPWLISALLRYVLAVAQPSWNRWDMFWPQRVHLQISPDFSSLEAAEILDALCDALGSTNVAGHADLKRIPLWSERLRRLSFLGFGAFVVFGLIDAPVPKLFLLIFVPAMLILLVAAAVLPRERSERRLRRQKVNLSHGTTHGPP